MTTKREFHELRDSMSLKGFSRNFTIPNVITLFRILLLPLFVFFLFSDDYALSYAIGILVICGLSDALDGYIARRFHMTSTLGQVLDPLADKLAIMTIFISFMLKGFIPIWIAVIILLREVLVLLFSIFFFFSKTQLPEPVMAGKYAIALLYIAVVISIFHQSLSLFLLIIALILSLGSGWSYALLAFSKLREKRGTLSS